MKLKLFRPLLWLLLLAGCEWLPLRPVTSMAPSAETEPSEVAVAALPLPQACADGVVRKVLVTAYPLRYPEQIRPGQFMGWAELAGNGVYRALAEKGTVTAVAASQRFPFKTTVLAPELSMDGERPSILQWAAQHHAQYVVTGVFDDFGVANKAQVLPERQMRLEAYVFDAFDGTLLARRSFAHTLLFGSLPARVIPGSQEFATSRLGKEFNALIEQVARWSEATVSCLPFAVRVEKVDGRRITLRGEVGSGLAVGMAFQSWRPGAEAPPRHPGVPLTARRFPTVVIKETGARVVAEIPQQRFPPDVRVGDVLYFWEGWRP